MLCLRGEEGKSRGSRKGSAEGWVAGGAVHRMFWPYLMLGIQQQGTLRGRNEFRRVQRGGGGWTAGGGSDGQESGASR